MGDFDFDGMEWFNVGISAIILSFLPLMQLAFGLNPGSTGFGWPGQLSYFCALFILGFAYIIKRPLSGILSVVATVSVLFNSIVLTFPATFASIDTGSLGIIVATIATVSFILCIVDFIWKISNISKTSRVFEVVPFFLITAWSILRFYNGLVSATSVGYMLVILMLMAVWAVFGSIISYLKAMHPSTKLPEIAGMSVDNIAFFVGCVICIMWLIAWSTLGIGLSVFG